MNIMAIYPILNRVCEYLQDHSPSLQMLKFLDIVLKDMVAPTPDLKRFYLAMMCNLVPSMKNCIYDEIYGVFSLLLDLCIDEFDGRALSVCLKIFTDKSTLRSKVYKATM